MLRGIRYHMERRALIVPARLSSERIKNKPLQRLNNGVTLIKNAMNTLSYVKGIDKFLATFDPELREYSDIPILHLTEEQSKGGWVEMTSGWRNLDYDKLYVLNLICHPFLKPETIKNITDIYTEKATTLVIEERGTVWDSLGHTTIGKDLVLDTKVSPYYYRSAHIADIYSPSDCGDPNGRMSNPYPLMYPFEAIELLDVDTLDQLDLIKRILI